MIKAANIDIGEGDCEEDLETAMKINLGLDKVVLHTGELELKYGRILKIIREAKTEEQVPYRKRKEEELNLDRESWKTGYKAVNRRFLDTKTLSCCC